MDYLDFILESGSKIKRLFPFVLSFKKHLKMRKEKLLLYCMLQNIHKNFKNIEKNY